jgi:hypothetical protein
MTDHAQRYTRELWSPYCVRPHRVQTGPSSGTHIHPPQCLVASLGQQEDCKIVGCRDRAADTWVCVQRPRFAVSQRGPSSSMGSRSSANRSVGCRGDEPKMCTIQRCTIPTVHRGGMLESAGDGSIFDATELVMRVFFTRNESGIQGLMVDCWKLGHAGQWRPVTLRSMLSFVTFKNRFSVESKTGNEMSGSDGI